MSEYLFVEKPFLNHLSSLGWEVIDQGCGIISRRMCPLQSALWTGMLRQEQT